jgi:hypothetical protein
MARNRKSQSAAIRFGPALKAFLLCVLLGGSGVGYVWQKEQIAKLGHQIKNKELQLHSLEEKNEQLRDKLAYLRSPKYLELRIKDLGLVIPQPSQVMRLPEPGAEPGRTRQEPQFAARSERPVLGP